jgi:broad specificity phosphatase PhoE
MPGFLSLTAYLPEYGMAVALQANSDPYSSKMKGRVSLNELLEIVLQYYAPEIKSYQEKTTIYLVRHAEKADDGTRDPDLTEQGRQRAENLAKVLAGKNISAVYSTPYKRTRQTGEPLANKLGLEIKNWNPGSMLSIYNILANHSGETVLVVGHSNTTPAMINLLVSNANMEQLDESDYGDLFRVQYKKGKGKLKTRSF